MSKPLTGVLIVLSNPTEGNEDDYNSWYTDIHLPEVVALPNVQSAQRFKLDTDQIPGTPGDFQYLATYDISGDPEAFIDELMSVEFPLPESFDTVNLRTFAFANLTDVVGEAGPDATRVLLALSNPAAGQEEEYNEWYNEHLDELVQSDAIGVETAQRFKLTENQVSADILTPSDHQYAALYRVSTPGNELFASFAAAGFGTPDAFDAETASFRLFEAITPVVGKESAKRAATA